MTTSGSVHSVPTSLPQYGLLFLFLSLDSPVFSIVAA